VTAAPKILDADEAAQAIERSLGKAAVPHLTVADAAARSGLALRDAERGLYFLTTTYRGHLRVSEDGDLVFLFPTGFTQPWIVRDKVDAALDKTWRGIVGAGRFLVRAWVMIVLVAYAAIFLAIVVASLFTRSNDSRSSFPGGSLLAGFLRVLADAFFWTFHPWSPLAIGYYDDDRAYRGEGTRRGRAAQPKDETPFYEKVNRFLFGPERPKPDERARERAILEEIRAKKGRIGLADVMRATGLGRDEADPLMARLMLDYDGEVEVSEEGGIFYRFAAIRKTADERPQDRGQRARPAWAQRAELPPLTGNEAGANLAIAGLNVFNMLMASVALAGHLTLERLPLLFMRHPPPEAFLPPTGTAVALGLVPLAFSALLFLMPIGRALARPLQARALARENGRRAVLQEVLGRVERKQDVDDRVLADAWQRASGDAPDPKVLTREVVGLGGDVEIKEDGTTRYRFVDLETEREALEAERAAASDEEARVGKLAFTSEERS
jgi:hypothetical protein